MNGSDPCALRHETTGIGYYDIKIEEETSGDSETIHSYAEQVGIVQLFDVLLY
jgi:hypothetical protein